VRYVAMCSPRGAFLRNGLVATSRAPDVFEAQT
jgi:hypothetical protein